MLRRSRSTSSVNSNSRLAHGGLADNAVRRIHVSDREDQSARQNLLNNTESTDVRQMRMADRVARRLMNNSDLPDVRQINREQFQQLGFGNVGGPADQLEAFFDRPTSSSRVRPQRPSSNGISANLESTQLAASSSRQSPTSSEATDVEFDADFVDLPDVGRMPRREMRRIEAVLGGRPESDSDDERPPSANAVPPHRSSATSQLPRSEAQQARQNAHALEARRRRASGPTNLSSIDAVRQMVLDDEQLASMMRRHPARSKDLLSETAKVDVLVTMRFQAKKDGFDKPTECSICYEAFHHLEEVKALPCATAGGCCASIFHTQCIEKWLRKDQSCPLCRRKYNFPSLKPEKEDEDDSVVMMLAHVLAAHGTPLMAHPRQSVTLRRRPQERWLPAHELIRRYRDDFEEAERAAGISASPSTGPAQQRRPEEVRMRHSQSTSQAARQNGTQRQRSMPQPQLHALPQQQQQQLQQPPPQQQQQSRSANIMMTELVDSDSHPITQALRQFRSQSAVDLHAVREQLAQNPALGLRPTVLPMPQQSSSSTLGTSLTPQLRRPSVL